MTNRVLPPHPGLIGAGPGRGARRVGSAPVDQAGETALRRTPASRREPGGAVVGWMIAPAALWLLVFLMVPLASIVVFSFFTSTGHGMSSELTLHRRTR